MAFFFKRVIDMHACNHGGLISKGSLVLHFSLLPSINPSMNFVLIYQNTIFHAFLDFGDDLRCTLTLLLELPSFTLPLLIFDTRCLRKEKNG